MEFLVLSFEQGDAGEPKIVGSMTELCHECLQALGDLFLPGTSALSDGSKEKLNTVGMIVLHLKVSGRSRRCYGP